MQNEHPAADSGHRSINSIDSITGVEGNITPASTSIHTPQRHSTRHNSNNARKHAPPTTISTPAPPLPLNKPKFRARKLETYKLLRVFKASDLTHEQSDSFMNALVGIDEFETRAAIPQVSTGVDKEEETEIHLQAILVEKRRHAVIPTPASNQIVSDYEEFYNPISNTKTANKALLPCPTTSLKEYVRITMHQLGEITGVQPLYDTGALAWAGDDYNFLNQHPNISVDLFEAAIDCLEEVAKRQNFGTIGAETLLDPPIYQPHFASVIGHHAHLAGARYLKQHRQELTISLLESLLEYWREKRRAIGRPLLPDLVYDDAHDQPIGADPYVCFRRRQLRTQLQRKTRRSDAQTADKVRRLHFDLEAACQGIRWCIMHDQLVRESVRLEGRIFEAYYEEATGTFSIADALAEASAPPLPPFRIVGQPLLTHQHPLRLSAASLRKAARRKDANTGVERRKKKEPKRKPKLAEGDQEETEELEAQATGAPTLPWYYSLDLARAVQRDVDALLAIDRQCFLGQEWMNQIPEERQATMALMSLFGLSQQDLQLKNPQDHGWKPVSLVKNPESGTRSVAWVNEALWLINQNVRCRGKWSKPMSQQDNWYQKLAKWMIEKPGLADMTLDTPVIFDDFDLSYHYTLPRIRVLPARDCAQLNNARVGNLNQHYLQLCASLKHPPPQSLMDWISATSGLLLSHHSGGKGHHGHHASAQAGTLQTGVNATGISSVRKTSPRKRVSNNEGDDPGASGEGTPSALPKKRKYTKRQPVVVAGVGISSEGGASPVTGVSLQDSRAATPPASSIEPQANQQKPSPQQSVVDVTFTSHHR